MIKLSLKFEVSLSKLAFVIVGSAACYGISRCVSNWISSDTQENDKDTINNSFDRSPENKMKVKIGHSGKTVKKIQATRIEALENLALYNKSCRDVSDIKTDQLAEASNKTFEVGVNEWEKNEDLSSKNLQQNNTDVSRHSLVDKESFATLENDKNVSEYSSMELTCSMGFSEHSSMEFSPQKEENREDLSLNQHDQNIDEPERFLADDSLYDLLASDPELTKDFLEHKVKAWNIHINLVNEKLHAGLTSLKNAKTKVGAQNDLLNYIQKLYEHTRNILRNLQDDLLQKNIFVYKGNEMLTFEKYNFTD